VIFVIIFIIIFIISDMIITSDVVILAKSWLVQLYAVTKLENI